MSKAKKKVKKKAKKAKKKVVKKKLTAKQELFCQMFSKDRDCFGNGTQAYIKAYSTKKKPVPYKSARVLAHYLLTNVNITSRIRILIDNYTSNEVVDKELGAIILQWADISSKIAAIREYNRVKKRVAPIGIDITSKGEKIEGFNFIKPRK